MKVKELWSDSDFEKMGWHDNRLYAISFPNEDFKLTLDIDYIFKWDRSIGNELKFWVSPCDLVFENVSELKIETDLKDSLLLFISDIKRSNPRLSPNQNVTIWDYVIECDNGLLSFSVTGFKQLVRAQPILSETQDLNRL